MRIFGWRDTHAGAAAQLGRGHKLFAALLALAVLGPQLRAMAGPYEDWPFTSAPMFARYHAPEDTLFDFVFELELGDGRVREIDPASDLGIGEIAFKRQFFGDYYGSIDPRHPAGHHAADTPDAFQLRLLAFCSRIAGAIEKRAGSTPNTIRIRLVEVLAERAGPGRIRPGAERHSRTVAVFDVRSGSLRRPPP